jgi:hypothetical protein
MIRETFSSWWCFRVSATEVMESSGTGFSLWIFKFRQSKKNTD